MILVGSISKPGGRKANEDAVAMTDRQEDHLFALADGLGGHSQGAAASSLAVTTSVSVFECAKKRDDSLLSLCMVESQRALQSAQQAQGLEREMKTTLVLLRIDENQASWAHIGDSRLYWFGKGFKFLRTMDHSVPQMLVTSGALREKDIRFHEDRNRLLRVLGAGPEDPRYELSAARTIETPASFLLCSDGFWELVLEKEMTACLRRSKTPNEWLVMMEKVALKRGRGKQMDNYSAIAVWARA